MPITYARGDMFASGADTLVNAVNCQGRMGAGVALEFAKRYPQMYAAYKHLCEINGLRPGKLQIFEEQGVTIVNFPTKDAVYQGSEMRYVCDGLQALREWLAYEAKLPESRVRTVAIPALGCGHGGLKWETVREIIDSYLRDLPQDIRVFEPHDEYVTVKFER